MAPVASPPRAPSPPSLAPAPDAVTASQVYTATLRLTPSRASVGDVVEVHGSGYPPGAAVELVWHTVDGRYELDGGTEFVGQRYVERVVVLEPVRADRAGRIHARIETPLDFGGPHDVRARVDGRDVSQASLTIEPSFELSPREGPVGTPVELRIVGVEADPRINTWHVLYDNRYVGFMSAVTTRGVAVARFRAAGPVGERQVSVWHNSHNAAPYLNWRQGPFRDVPGTDFTFRVTHDAGAPPPLVEDLSAGDAPWPVANPGPAALALSLDRGVQGQTTVLRGTHLPPDTALTLRWQTMVGNRVWASGFGEVWRPLGSVRTGPDGAFETVLTIPDDLGGQHRIEVLDGDVPLAATGLVILPMVVSASPACVRAGDSVSIHLKGVGWTTYDNVYGVTYDNAYIGYVCGFATAGNVVFPVTATGDLGTHLIDLYPMIYKGKDATPRVYTVPQLTYAEDHPQRPVPAIRLAVEVVA